MSALSSSNPIGLRFRLVEGEADRGVIEGWRNDRRTAGPGEISPEAVIGDARAMVRRFLAYHRRDRRFLSDLLQALAENRLENAQWMGEELLKVLDNGVELLEAVRECVRIASVFGAVPQAGRFEKAGEDYRRWRESLIACWPWVDHARLKRSYASYEGGRLRPTKELLDELHDSAHP
jgi:hypothetical protein